MGCIMTYKNYLQSEKLGRMFVLKVKAVDTIIKRFGINKVDGNYYN